MPPNGAGPGHSAPTSFSISWNAFRPPNGTKCPPGITRRRDSLDRDSPLSAEEAALWLAEFGELDAAPETKEAFGPGPTLLTDAEIARIQREIDSESVMPARSFGIMN